MAFIFQRLMKLVPLVRAPLTRLRLALATRQKARLLVLARRLQGTTMVKPIAGGYRRPGIALSAPVRNILFTRGPVLWRELRRRWLFQDLVRQRQAG